MSVSTWWFPRVFVLYLCVALLHTTTVSSDCSACNLHSEYCSRSYSNVTQIVAHNSPFVGDLVTQNQHISVTKQLNYGIRFLQGQTHKFLGTIRMCHTSCIEEDAGSLKSFLTTIKDWLDASNNTCEVLTLLLVNSDDLDVSEFGSVFEAVGLDSYAYAPSKTLSSLSSWPTLSSLISSSTRLIVFMDYEADTSSVPYILDEFTYFFETPYDTTDPDFPQCSIDRPSDLSTAEAADSRMYLVNHFLDDEVLGILIPDEDDAATTNSVQSIAGQVEICLGLYENRAPKGVLVDYLEKGSVFEAERLMNNLVS